jgi:hypothetical protein
MGSKPSANRLGAQGDTQNSLPSTFVNDQNAIGDLAPDSPDEPLGIAVRSRTARRNLDYLDARTGEDGIT